MEAQTVSDHYCKQQGVPSQRWMMCYNNLHQQTFPVVGSVILFRLRAASFFHFLTSLINLFALIILLIWYETGKFWRRDKMSILGLTNARCYFPAMKEIVEVDCLFIHRARGRPFITQPSNARIHVKQCDGWLRLERDFQQGAHVCFCLAISTRKWSTDGVSCIIWNK